MPATSLPALEHHLDGRLLELDKLHRERSHLPTALAHAEAGQRIDDLLDKIAELQRMIDTSPAETLEDAAVKLRRLGASVDRGQPTRLLAGAVPGGLGPRSELHISRRGCGRGPFRLWRGWRRDRPSLAGLGLSSSDGRFRAPGGGTLDDTKAGPKR